MTRAREWSKYTNTPGRFYRSMQRCVVLLLFFFVCWILSILVQITADEEQYWYEMRYPSDISGFVSYIR